MSWACRMRGRFGSPGLFAGRLSGCLVCGRRRRRVGKLALVSMIDLVNYGNAYLSVPAP